MCEINKIWENTLPNEKKSCLKKVSNFGKCFYDLSIIVPIYNSELYLKECLDSIVMQKTKYSYEIILIDDGSSDNSKDICLKYMEKYSNIILLEQKNKGASSARNLGIEKSNGKYISFIDSDDFVEENFIEIMLSNLLIEDADFIKCGYNEFDSKTGNLIKSTRLKNKVYFPCDFYKKNIKGHACMCVFKRKVFEKVQFPEGFWYEDIIMKFIVFPLCNKIITIDNTLYYYRVNIDSTSNNNSAKKNNKCISQLYLIEDCVLNYIKFNLSYDKCFFKNFYRESFSMLWLRTRKLDKSIKKVMFNELCDFFNNQEFKECYGIHSFILKHKNIFLWSFVSIIELTYI